MLELSGTRCSLSSVVAEPVGYEPGVAGSYLVTPQGENLPESEATIEKSRVKRFMEEFLDKIESPDPAIPDGHVGQKTRTNFLILCKAVQGSGFCSLQCRILPNTG